MKINDLVFGELEYDYIWFKEITIKFLKEDIKIALMVNGDEDGEFEDEQYLAYKKLMENWNDIQEDILNKILEYYNLSREELGYSIDSNKDYPNIDNINQIAKKINLVGIIIPYSGAYDGRECGLTFECTWDNENGIGVYLVDEQIIEVGYQDIVM